MQRFPNKNEPAMQLFRPRLYTLSLALLLTACANSPGPGGSLLVRDAKGISSERLGRITSVVRTEVDKGTFPGAVTLVARNGQVVHFEAHGYLDAAKTKPMTKDAIFRLASMTKPLVSVATMMLVEQGTLKINDPISTWLPELKDIKVETAAGDVVPIRPVTVQDLLRHTAGMVYGGSTRSPRIKKMYQDLNIEALENDITAGDMLKNLATIPLAHQPGTFFEYSISVDVLGLLLERATKKNLDLLLREMLTEPLGMKETGWWVGADKRARLAETLDSDAQKTVMLKSYRQYDNPAVRTYLKGGAGMVGTTEDYFRFLQMVANGGEYAGRRYLSKKTVEFMLSDHTLGMGGTTFASTGPGYGFGLGFAVRAQDGFSWTAGSKGDAMWAGAWGTSFWIDPKEKLVGILMSQSPSNRVQTRMLFKNVVYAAVVE